MEPSPTAPPGTAYPGHHVELETVGEDNEPPHGDRRLVGTADERFEGDAAAQPATRSLDPRLLGRIEVVLVRGRDVEEAHGPTIRCSGRGLSIVADVPVVAS